MVICISYGTGYKAMVFLNPKNVCFCCEVKSMLWANKSITALGK